MQEIRRVGRIGAELDSLAGADLYRDNAFRISGLPVDASLRRIRRRSTELEAAERLGAELPAPGGPLPVDPSPRNEEILAALRRLHEPARRLVEESLWLWPEDDDGVAALHNSAVEAHVKALEEDCPDSAVERRWTAVYRRWDRVLSDDRCWERLARRVEDLADPRLRAGDVDDLRLALPELLLASHAAFAVAEFGRDEDRGVLQAAAMGGSGYDEGLVHRALLTALRPQTARLKSLTERTRDASDGDGFDGACRTAVEESRLDLAALRALVGADHPVVSGVADELASAMRERVVGVVNRIPEEERVARRVQVDQAIRWLDRAASIAAGRHAVRQIEEDVQTLLANLVVFSCRAAEEESRRSPLAGPAAHRGLMEATREPLRRLESRRHHDHAELCDEVAGTAFLILVEYARLGGDARRTAAELRPLLRLARDPALHRQLSLTASLLESGGRLDPGASGPSRPVRTTDPHPCAMCGRPSFGTRVIRMVRVAPHSRPETDGVEIPCCARCRRKRPTPFLGGCLVLLLFAALVVLGLVVWLSPLTWSSADWWFGWLILALVLAGSLSERSERRRQRLEGCPDIRRRLIEGWRIVD